jgi:hypothetical protein
MQPPSLVVGRTYYRLTFADRDLTMPGVTPLVFLGEIALEDGTPGFAFQDTVSYVRFGSMLQMHEHHEEVAVELLTAADLRTGVLDVGTVAGEVAAAAQRAAELNHPVLPILEG